VHESGSIDASVDRVWEFVRPLDFSFLPSVATCVVENRQSPAKVGSERRVVYKDGTVQLLKLTELNDATFTVTWDVIMSEPSVSYSSAVHTVRLRRVTQPTKQTMVELVSDYSSDASLEVIEDSRFKKLEFVKALRDAVLGRGPPASLQAFNRRAEQAEELIRLLTLRMEQLERSRGAVAESKGNEGVFLQVTGTVRAGKSSELVAASRDYTERVIKRWGPALTLHTGIVLQDDSRWSCSLYFKDSASVIAYSKSKESQGFHEQVLTPERVDANSLKMAITGNLTPAAREFFAKYAVLPNNGFAR